MLSLFYDAQSLIIKIVYIGIFLVGAFALIDAISRPAQAFLAAGKMNKQGWLIILGLALLVQILPVGLMLMLVGLVAGLVYLLDARPALRSITRR